MSNNSSLSTLKNCNILITGGAGYLATNMLLLLRDTECNIIRLDRPGVLFEKITGRFKVSDVFGDITEPSIWDPFVTKVDVVFHFAAQTSVYKAAEDPVADLNINVLPIVRLIEAIRRTGHCPFVLFSGTVTETGLTDCLPVNENHPDNPITVYDLHKLMAESYIKYFTREKVISGAILRLANVYGPGPRSGSADRGILNMMIRKALNGETLTVYGKGDYIRDYIFIDDVAKAFLSAAFQGEQIAGKHFVIGSGQGTTFSDAVNLVADRAAIVTGRRVPVVYRDPPKALSPIETRNFIADSKSFTEATGWKQQISLLEGIDRTIEYFLVERDRNV
jgi:nucleoside-diphosphate-sugar epimerase